MSSQSTEFWLAHFVKEVIHTIQVYQMLSKGESVLVGVSGGPDSTGLLNILFEISKGLDLTLGVVHLNHGLRNNESDTDAEFVISQAKNMGLPCFIEKKNILNECKEKRMSLEEAGREARYEFFNKVADANGFNRIAVGHHADDNAEIVLMNLIRGSGSWGLKGIPPVRGKIIRPLIRTSHESILSYLEYRQISYRTDPSNSDERFFRNRVRHQLLPLLKSQYNPKTCQALNRLGNIIYYEEDWFDNHIRAAFDKTIREREPDRILLSIENLLDNHVAVQRRLIRHALLQLKGDLRRVTFDHIETILAHSNTNPHDFRLDLPDRIRVQKFGEHLMISKGNKILRSSGLSENKYYPICFKYEFSESDISKNSIFIKEINSILRFIRLTPENIPLKTAEPNIAFFDWDRLSFPLIVRNYRPGDRFKPLGMAGTQTLKKFFINNKVNKLVRDSTPILLSKDVIMWICGSRISDQFKLTRETKSALCVKFFSNSN